jgi:glycosyltransferase involved in cell wall biosynthesis
MCKGLVVGIQDPRYPIHGSARLTLAVLHALSLNGHRIHYIASWGNTRTEMTNIITRSRFGKSSLLMIKISRIKRPSDFINIIQTLRSDYYYLLCLDRRYTLACKYLSNKLGIPMITYMDSPPYLHRERLVGIKDYLARPVALAWYITIGYLSDITMCVSEYIEDYLHTWGVRAITIEPTFALLDETNDSLKENNDSNYEVEEINNNTILCSCPHDLAILTALRNPNLPIIITGPGAYYLKEYLKMKQISREKVRNVYLMHNVGDKTLEELHEKVIMSLIARPALSGISMTLIQELYFGKAVITDTNTTSRIRGLTEAGAVIVNDDYREWPNLIKKVIRNDKYIDELSTKAKWFFDKKLSPTTFAKSFEHVLRSINV